MMWWIKRPERLAVELQAVEDLQANEPWLVRTRETLPEGLTFAVEFDINLNGEAVPFILKYPNLFPDAPPAVFPRDGRRHSGHQYGTGGEMCLEYRSDNWDPSVTGALMITSTYRLLSGEQPAQDARAIVPDAHRATLGQRLRDAKGRFLATPGFRAFVEEMAAGTCAPGTAIEHVAPGEVWVAYIAAIGPLTQPKWTETEIPAVRVKPGPAVLVRVSALDEVAINKYEHIEELIRVSGGSDSLPTKEDDSAQFVVVADEKSARMFYTFRYEGHWKVFQYRTVDLELQPQRLARIYVNVATKKVGILGAGSLGSKVAVTLARSGVQSFVLVDGDILQPGNLVRHELDARALGAHKVQGLEERIRAVAPRAEVKGWRVALGGQESSATTSSVLNDLGSCDLVIEATTNPQAFNFAAAAARGASKPMVWTEVYAGGIGGFVGRVRPGIDPPPHTARLQYSAWCRDQEVPWIGDDRGYDSQSPNGPTLVAADADVSVIAGHASRLALDTLMRPVASEFPHSAYVIGLAQAWIFSAPFDVRPFDFTSEGTWDSEITQVQADKAIERIVSILQRSSARDRTGT
ncbi:MAG: ThiF family adenylyltransferase [Gammaproteobacteria bacterium]|nr:ThiF family adenylyltransferase [Gammaproteobacteria bacterium]